MPEPVLAVENLMRRFGALIVTHGVSLDVRAGEIHALIGPNGAGKSTLLKQISGELAPDSGDIRLDGLAVTHWSVARRARQGMARSFQVSSLMPQLTVLQHLVLTRQARARRSYGFLRPVLKDGTLLGPAHEAARRAGLESRTDACAAVLSHGERRQLEIAMALALEARIFLLDEPMAGMDPEGRSALTQLLGELREVAPILLIEHDMDVVFALADRISVLVHGRLIASGTVRDIRANPDVRQAYLGGN